jgi:HK97 family phage prohead protease
MMHYKELSPVMEIKSIEDAGTFTGYASVFAVTDSHRERTVPGCFVPSLADHKRAGTSVKMFWHHDLREPIGKWTDMAEDSKGLWVEGKLNMDVQRAREAHSLLRNKDIDGLSIGYFPEEFEEDKARPGVTLLKKVRLVEVSVVSMGSNHRALIDNVKSEICESEFYAALKQILVAGELPSKRAFEKGMRDAFQLSNAQAERATRLLYAQGEPGEKTESTAGLEAALAELRAAAAGFHMNP